jgi:hypothetical protein
MTIKEIIQLLKQTNQFEPYADVCTSDVVCAIEALQTTATEYQQAADKMAMEHKVERDTLRQQLAAIRIGGVELCKQSQFAGLSF